jgi:flagellar biosynthesis/type III secretory pathway chaperone
MTTIATVADVERAITELAAVIEKLSGVVEQETALVRAGKLREARVLEPTKSQLAGELYVAGERLRANAKAYRSAAPAHCAALVKLQDTFRAVLQKNMIVLATAHSVSEGIMRRLSRDLTRKAGPQTYGATGRTAAPNSRYGRPLAVSRSL